MLQRNKVCTLFFEEVPGVETLAAQEGVGRGDGFPFQVSELATGRRGHFESSMEDRREATGRVAGGGQSLSWGGRGSPLRVHLSAFFPVLVLGHWRRQEKLGRGRGGRRPPVPSLPFGMKGREGRMAKQRQTCPQGSK